ncbi:MAG TPA: serine/threonine-protein kinase, partial [Pirellulales bacterium]|nr:serine/threonine-protein kinase [Pirellulales bacterium]
MSRQGDRNLLLGILALQMDFIGRDALVAAMNAWVLEKATPLGEILVRQNALDAAGRDLLEALVQKHVALHGGDAERSLASVGSLDDVGDELRRLADGDVQASLAHVGGRSGADDSTRSIVDARAQSGTGSLRYHVLRPHAKGGLGEVFVARDEELRREVALKEIQSRHAGDPVSRQRFVQEAEITGNLEHPGIVPVYGLGAYADGRPFYAMRFIKGDSLKDAIAKFHGSREQGTEQEKGKRGSGEKGRRGKGEEGSENDQSAIRSALRRISPETQNPQSFFSVEFRQLLGRLIDVCNAVEYAHSRGVLHRDLKPGNVMLGKYGETLVVDWGLAKALGRAEPAGQKNEGDDNRQAAPGSLDGERAFQPASGDSPTAMGSAVGTPAYMSPEQAAGRLDLLSPASDVYSLGATLYSLLTGRAPFQSSGDSKAILARVERGEFPLPRAVRADIPMPLEAICVKAMARQPAQRYAAPRGLAEDLEHWMADEAVSAHRDGRPQRMARWFRRHRAWTQAAAAALVAVTLVSLGALAAVDAARRDAQRQRDIARDAQAAEEAQVVKTKAALDAETKARQKARRAIDDYVAAVREAELLGDERFQPLRKKLLAHALEYYREFIREREHDTAASAELAEALSRVGVISSRTGSATDALAAFAGSVEAYEKLVAQEPNVANHARMLATSYENLANWQANTGDLASALAGYAKALSIQERLAAEHGEAAEYQIDLMTTHDNLGALQAETGDRAGALANYGAALAIGKPMAQRHPELAKGRSQLAKTYNNLANLQWLEGNSDAALASHAEALEVRRKLAAEKPDDATRQSELARSLSNLGLAQAGKGERTAALASYVEALSIRRKLAQDHPVVTGFQRDLFSTLNNLGNLQRASRDLVAALETYIEAHSIARKLAVENPEVTGFQSNLAGSYGNLGNLYSGQGQVDLALEHYQRAQAIHERLAREQASVLRHQSDLAICHYNIGVVEAGRGNFESAKAGFQAALAIQRRLAENPAAVRHLLEAGELCRVLGQLEYDQGHALQALEPFAQAIDTLTPLLDRQPTVSEAKEYLRKTHWGRAAALVSLARFREAVADFERAIELDDGRSGKLLRTRLAYARARAGDHERAAADAARFDLADFPG